MKTIFNELKRSILYILVLLIVGFAFAESVNKKGRLNRKPQESEVSTDSIVQDSCVVIDSTKLVLDSLSDSIITDSINSIVLERDSISQDSLEENSNKRMFFDDMGRICIKSSQGFYEDIS